MRRTPIIRNLAFLVMVSATLAAMQSRVLTMGTAIVSFCYAWNQSHDCYPCQEGGIPPDWSASGQCDFSAFEDPEQLGAAYCYDQWEACVSACEDEYPYYLAGFNWDPWDPCYDILIRPSCWVTWAQGGCDAGMYSSWTCPCSRWNVCECDPRAPAAGVSLATAGI